MLFSIFLVLLGLSLAFMVIGYYVNIPMISMFGALLMFGMGFMILNVNVEVRTGDTSSFTYNGSTPTTVNTTYQYDNYDFGDLGQYSYGWLIMILGALLFIIFIFMLGG